MQCRRYRWQTVMTVAPSVTATVIQFAAVLPVSDGPGAATMIILSDA